MSLQLPVSWRSGILILYAYCFSHGCQENSQDVDTRAALELSMMLLPVLLVAFLLFQFLMGYGIGQPYIACTELRLWDVFFPCCPQYWNIIIHQWNARWEFVQDVPSQTPPTGTGSDMGGYRLTVFAASTLAIRVFTENSSTTADPSSTSAGLGDPPSGFLMMILMYTMKQSREHNSPVQT